MHCFVEGPEVIQTSKEYKRCIGESIKIHCTAAGRPLPDVSLYHNDVFLTRNASSLTFRIQVNLSAHFGVYTCVSQNSQGVANITTTLKIQRKLNYITLYHIATLHPMGIT